MSEITNKLIPLTKWPDYHSWPNIGGLRHLVFYENKNGFSRVVRRIGRRVLIHEGEFFRWVEKRNGFVESMADDKEPI